MLPGAVAVQEVPFVGVDLQTEGYTSVKAFSLKHVRRAVSAKYRHFHGYRPRWSSPCA